MKNSIITAFLTLVLTSSFAQNASSLGNGLFAKFTTSKGVIIVNSNTKKFL